MKTRLNAQLKKLELSLFLKNPNALHCPEFVYIWINMLFSVSEPRSSRVAPLRQKDESLPYQHPA